jgi:hypothetical protein
MTWRALSTWPYHKSPAPVRVFSNMSNALAAMDEDGNSRGASAMDADDAAPEAAAPAPATAKAATATASIWAGMASFASMVKSL